MIPFEDATAGAGHVWVPYEREVVRAAPEVHPGAPLTQKLEAGLRAHFTASGAAAAVPHSRQPQPEVPGIEIQRAADDPGASAPGADRGEPAWPSTEHPGWEHRQQWEVRSTGQPPPPQPRRPPEMRTVPPPRPPEPTPQPPSQGYSQRPAAPTPQPQAPYAYPAARPPSQDPPADRQPRPPAPAPVRPASPRPRADPGQAQPMPPPSSYREFPDRPLEAAPPPRPLNPVEPQPSPQPQTQPRPERVVSLPVIGELDRAYRVEIRFRGEISVSGELGGLSVTPVGEQDA